MDAAFFRRAQFAALKQLGWDDVDRRRMYGDLKVPASSKDFTPLDRAKVVAHLNKLTGRAKPGAPHEGQQGYVDKIEAQLADMGLPWSYAIGVLKNISADKCAGKPGVDRIEWATPGQLRKVVAALGYEQEKRAKLADVDALLIQRGLDRKWVSAWLAVNLPSAQAKWERTTRTLNVVIALLKGSGS